MAQSLHTSSLQVSIPAVQVGEEFVSFTLVVTKGGASWTVRRRFQDFDRLHVAARRAWLAAGGDAGGGPALPELPPKKVLLGMRKFDPDFIESRRAGLEAYMQRLVLVVPPDSCEAVDAFLKYAQNWLREAIEALAGIRELQQVVRLLRQAVEAAAAAGDGGSGGPGGGIDVSSPGDRALARGSGAAARHRASGDDGDEGEEDEEGGGSGVGGVGVAHAISAADSAAAAAALVPLLGQAVKSLSEYAAVIVSRNEDAEAAAQAAASSCVSLDGDTRRLEEDADEERHAIDVLVSARLRECALERGNLVKAAEKVRTVAVELLRVSLETSALTGLAAAHSAVVARVRSSLTEWERGTAHASTSSPPAGSDTSSGSSSTTGSHFSAVAAAAEAQRVVSPREHLAATVASARAVLRALQLHPVDAGSSPLAFPSAPVLRGDGRGGVSAPPAAPTAALLGPSLAAGLLLHAVVADTHSLAALEARLRDGPVYALPPIVRPSASPIPAPQLHREAEGVRAAPVVQAQQAQVQNAGPRLNPLLSVGVSSPVAPSSAGNPFGSSPGNPFEAVAKTSAPPKGGNPFAF